MPVDLERLDGGWLVRIPVCGPEDAILNFTLSDSRDDPANPQNQISFRPTGASGGRRLVELRLSSDTIESGKVNADEIREVDRTGTVDLPLMVVTVITEKGYAYFPEPLGELTRTTTVARVIGDRVAESSPDSELLSGYCG